MRATNIAVKSHQASITVAGGVQEFRAAKFCYTPFLVASISFLQPGTTHDRFMVDMLECYIIVLSLPRLKTTRQQCLVVFVIELSNMTECQ